MNKFVIAALPRTGSNMLVSLLGSHSRIACYGELFRKELALVKDIRAGILRKNDEYLDIDYRLASPYKYLDDVFSLSDPKVLSCGFKLMLTQSLDLSIELASSDNWKVIFLERENVLACYSSQEIAKVTGQGAARIKDKIVKAEVEFDELHFERYLLRRKKLIDKFLASTDTSSEKFLHLKYTSLTRESTYEDIQSFLGVESEKIRTYTKKRNSSNIVSRFTNADDVRTYLKAKGVEFWAEE